MTNGEQVGLMIWMEALFFSVNVLLQISPEESEKNHENLTENLPEIPI
jgi:hypothetical protein